MDPILAGFVADARDRLRLHQARLPQEPDPARLSEEVLADLTRAIELVTLLGYELEKAKPGTGRDFTDLEREALQ